MTHFSTDECRCSSCVTPFGAPGTLVSAPRPAGFTDANGAHCTPGDLVEYEFGVRRGTLVEVLQDGDACVQFFDGHGREWVKFARLRKVRGSRHPMQQTDSPPLVPDLTNEQINAARETWCTPLGELGCLAPFCPTCPPQGRTFGKQRTLIAFTGLAGSGKTTAAAHLVDHHGFTRVRFAGPLKAMMAALGLSADEIDGRIKEVPCALLGGRTPRYAMQTLGTEWGRDLISSDLWIRAWQAAVDKLPAGAPVVVDDCRFPNEAEAVRSAGGALVRIERSGAGQGAAGHSSEGQNLREGLSIRNDFSLANFRWELDEILTRHVKAGEFRHMAP